MSVWLVPTPPFLAAVAVVEAASDDLVDSATLLLLLGGVVFVALCGLVASFLWPQQRVVGSARAKAPASRRHPPQSVPASQRRPIPSPPSSRRRTEESAPSSRGDASTPPASGSRVISLHAVTPGQEPNEYNVGDTEGTRGAALRVT